MDPKAGLPERLAQFPTQIARLLPRGGISSLTQGIEFISLWRWARLSLLVGVVVGLAASGVFALLELADAVFVRHLAGVVTPAFGAEKPLFDYGYGDFRWYLVLLLPAVGGLLTGLIIWKWAPEVKGPGTDDMIDSFHRHDGYIRKRVPLAKLFATLFTLGTGGSGGREGPTAHIGAGFGSFLAQRLKLSVKEQRMLVLAGAAGGLSALFRAPLGAALWALEIIYRDDFEAEGLFPCLVSAVTSYSVFTTIYGQGTLFQTPGNFDFSPMQLPFYALMAIVCAPIAVLWEKTKHEPEHRFWDPLKVPTWAKPALGGLLLGALCLAVPWVFGSGYGWMQDALKSIDDPTRLLPIGYKGAAILAGIALAKILATSLTIASGGSAGSFAPSLFIGGFIGGACGLVFHQIAPSIVPQPGTFVLVGMGAVYGGIAKVPIATIILVSELFGSYDLLVPLMFTEMITLVLLRKYTLYPTQVENHLESPAHMAEFTVDVLEKLYVSDHYSKGRATQPIASSMNLRDFLEHVSQTADNFYVVADADGKLEGIVSLSNVRSVVAEGDVLDFVLVNDAMWPFKAVSPDTDLRSALQTFLESGYDHMPVVAEDDPNRVLGMLSQSQIFAAYNAEILRRRLLDEAPSGGGGEGSVAAD